MRRRLVVSDEGKLTICILLNKDIFCGGAGKV